MSDRHADNTDIGGKLNDMVPRPKNGLSLCAGGGGLDMGLMLAEPGFHTRCFVEWEDYPRRSLIAAQRAGYFAPAPIWDDLTTFDGRPFRGTLDTILAGYPCQPFSQAGQRKGADDERHLWPDVARVIREIEPEWVFLENVAGHVSLGAETVLRELRDMGFTPAAGLFSAAETGLPHERLRWFCVAHRDDGSGAIQPQGRQPDERGWTGNSREPMADASGAERQGIKRCERDAGGWQEPDGYSALRSRAGLFPPGPSDRRRWTTAIDMAPDFAPAVSLDDVRRAADHFAQMVARGELAEAEAQSRLRRMADGLAARSRALRLLGNGVVPLAAGYAWRTLSATHGLRSVDMGAADETAGARTDEIVVRAAE